ncbi:MAG: ethanolamine ammonia-lyase subunit EutC [Pseudolabrys sp.]
MSANDKAWADLRRLTAARIGLSRSGASLATTPLLEFQLAHARARDAVHDTLDEARLAAELDALGLPILTISSQADDRAQYLLRPDLGRRLSSDAQTQLAAHADSYDVTIVIADGLSAGAVQSHAAPLLAAAVPALRSDGWRTAPLVIVRNGRVGVGDAVAGALGAECVVVLIGERPGLTAPDSMGAYLTWRPSPTTTDAGRNCISNIRPAGIGYEEAAFKLGYLLRAIKSSRLSGVALKDDSDRLWLGKS